MFNWILWVWNDKVGVGRKSPWKPTSQEVARRVSVWWSRPTKVSGRKQLLWKAGLNIWNTLIKTTYIKGPMPLPSWFSFDCLYLKMGLSHSKAHPRVIKVAPLQNKEEETPSASPADFAFTQNLEEKSMCSLARLQDRSRALEGKLPPLRETWYGRYSAGKHEAQCEIYVFVRFESYW